MSEKYCPNCGLRLPREAHFCPRCMYEFPRVEMVPQKSQKKKQHVSVIVVAFISIIIIVLFLGLFVIKNTREKGTDHSTVSKERTEKEQIEQAFDTGEDLPSNEEILYDLKDCMTDWETVNRKLGKETKAPVSEGEFEIHFFENVEIMTDEFGMVKAISIDYSETEDKTKYGLYGFCGNSTRENVKSNMGAPNQNYGENEYFYRFDGLEGAPTLKFVFSDDGVVEALEYYKVSSD